MWERFTPNGTASLAFMTNAPAKDAFWLVLEHSNSQSLTSGLHVCVGANSRMIALIRLAARPDRLISMPASLYVAFFNPGYNTECNATTEGTKHGHIAEMVCVSAT